MKLIVNGRNIELTEAIKAYVAEKTERLQHHYDFIQELHVFLGVEKNPRINTGQHAEATVVVNRAVLRVETASEDLYGSIDKLVDKVDRVLARHKTKLLGRAKSAKGESIRRVGMDTDTVVDNDVMTTDVEELEGVYLTYEEDEEAIEKAEAS